MGEERRKVAACVCGAAGGRGRENCEVSRFLPLNEIRNNDPIPKHYICIASLFVDEMLEIRFHFSSLQPLRHFFQPASLSLLLPLISTRAS